MRDARQSERNILFSGVQLVEEITERLAIYVKRRSTVCSKVSFAVDA